MTDGSRSAFLAGERPDDVLVYLAARAVSDVETLAAHGERVNEGIAFVLDAERGRRVAKRAMGTDPMDLAKRAMDRDGKIDLVALRGDCPAIDTASGSPSHADSGAPVDPDTDDPDSPDDTERTHVLRQVFAFAEERNAEAGGIYAEGDVIHAYAVCSCGTAYSDRWVAGSRDRSG